MGGCACCKPGPRETVLPRGWADRAGRLSMDQVLAWPHNVTPGAIRVLFTCFADGLTAERVAAVRARYTA